VTGPYPLPFGIYVEESPEGYRVIFVDDEGAGEVLSEPVGPLNIDVTRYFSVRLVEPVGKAGYRKDGEDKDFRTQGPEND